MSIRNIIFDLGGVLLIDRPAESIRRFDRLGFVEARGLLSPYPEEGLFPDLEVGRISKEQFRDIVRTTYGHDLTIDEITWALAGYAGEAELYKLAYLRTQLSGYRLFLATNTNAFLYDLYLSPHFLPSGESLESYFERCYASHLLHIKKPDPRFYHLILDENHLDPRESLYIDDREENVTAARELGLTTLRPQNGTDWRPALERLLCHE